MADSERNELANSVGERLRGMGFTPWKRSVTDPALRNMLTSADLAESAHDAGKDNVVLRRLLRAIKRTPWRFEYCGSPLRCYRLRVLTHGEAANWEIEC